MSTIISCYPINQSLHPTSSYCRQLHRYSKSTFYKYLNYISCCPRAWVISAVNDASGHSVEHGPCKRMKTWVKGSGDTERKEKKKKHSEYALEINSGQWWVKGKIRTFSLSLFSVPTFQLELSNVFMFFAPLWRDILGTQCPAEVELREGIEIFFFFLWGEEEYLSESEGR